MSTSHHHHSHHHCKAIQIVQGEDRLLKFRISETGENGGKFYMNLTGATAIELRAAGSVTYVSFTMLALEITIIEPLEGFFSVHMSDTKTAQLLAGSDQSIEVIVDIGTEKRIAQLEKAITVIPRIYT